MRARDYLFRDYELRGVLEGQEKTMLQEIDSIEPNRLLNTSIDDLVSYFEQKYKLEVPQLLEDKITADQSETKVDISHDPNRIILDPSRPV